MATLNEMIDYQNLTVDYSEDPESVALARKTLGGLANEQGASTIDPSDLIQLKMTPGVSPAAQRNAVAAGYQSPELAARLSKIDANANAAEADIRARNTVIDSILAAKQMTAQQIAENDAELIRTKQLQQSMTAAEWSAYLSRAGVNTSQVDQLVNVAAGEQLADYQRMMALKKQIQAKAAVSFFDDPVDFIMNQLTVGDDVAEHNAVVAQFNQRENFIKSAASTASLVRDANAGKIAATTNAEATVLARKAALTAQQKELDLAEEREKLGIATTKDIQTIQQAATSQLAGAENRVVNQEDRAALRIREELEAKDRLLIAQQRVKMAKDEDERRAAAAAVKKEEAEQQATRDARIAKALGPSYKITTEKQLKAQSPKRRAELERVLSVFDEELGYPVFETPIEALASITSSNRAATVTNSTQQQFLQTVSKLKVDTENVNKEKKGEELTRQVNTVLEKRVDEWQKNPTTAGPPTSSGENWKLFKIQPLDQLAKNSPSLAGNKVSVEVNLLKAALPSGTEITPQMVLESMAKKLAASGGKDISTLATETAQFFQQGLAANNALLQPERFGFSPQTSYRIPVPSSTFMGFGIGQDMYDIASPKGATLYLGKLLRDAKIQAAVDSGNTELFRMDDPNNK